MKIKTVEEIIDEQYLDLVNRFKPSFGNTKHIEIAQQMAKMGELQKKLKVKIESAKAAQQLSDELIRLKRNVVYLLKEHAV